GHRRRPLRPRRVRQPHRRRPHPRLPHADRGGRRPLGAVRAGRGPQPGRARAGAEPLAGTPMKQPSEPLTLPPPGANQSAPTTGGNWSGAIGILDRLVGPLWVSFAAVAVAAVIAIPIGVAVGHRQRGQVAATAVANLGRAVPSLAVLAFVVAAGWGIGFVPTF